MTQSAVRSRPAATGDGPRLGAAGLFAVVFVSVLSSLDAFVVNVALPSIGSGLGAGSGALELVVAGYAMAYAALLVLGGRLGDIYGRRRLAMAGLAAFGAASLACGLAPSPAWLVAARVAQGGAAALMLPQTLATIQAATTGERRARAMAMFGAAAGLAMADGQILGGLLVSADVAGTGWRSVFLINVPAVALGLVLIARAVPETRSPRPTPLDLPGAVLLGVALLAVLAPLTEGRAAGWPAWSWACLVLAPFAAWFFFATQRRAERAGRVPLLPPSLLRLGGMRRALPLVMLSMSGFGGFLFVIAVSLQDGLGYGPIGSGLTVAPYALAFFAGSLAGPRLTSRVGARVIALGIGVQVAGVAALASGAALAWGPSAALVLAPGMVLGGLGQGMHLPVLFRAVLADVPAASAGVGGGVLSTGQQIALASGIGLYGALFLSLVPVVGIGSALAWTLTAQGATAAVNLVLALSLRLRLS